MNFFKQFSIAIYQFDKYNELINLKAIKVFLYEAILFIMTILISIIPFVALFIGYGGTEGLIKEFVPDFKIEDGKLEAQAVVYNEGGTLIIVDAENERSEFDLQDTISGVIFDKEKIIVNTGMEVKSYSYNDFLNQLGVDKFEKNDILNYISEINVGIVVFVAIIIAAAAVSELFGIMLLSLFAVIFNKILKNSLNYPQLLKMSIYARTLSIVLSFALGLLGIGLDFIFIVALNFAYLFFAIKKNQSDNVFNIDWKIKIFMYISFISAFFYEN